MTLSFFYETQAFGKYLRLTLGCPEPFNLAEALRRLLELNRW